MWRSIAASSSSGRKRLRLARALVMIAGLLRGTLQRTIALPMLEVRSIGACQSA
jgi:hypothetical protein